MNDTTDSPLDDDDYISKSQLKRDANAITDLGVELAQFTDAQIKSVPMSDSLFNAIMEYKRIRKHSALKRQRLYIGKLIRQDDWETIRDHIIKLKEPVLQNNARFKEMENWRDKMLTEGDQAVNAFIGEHHQADRQKLRQMVKNAIKEQEKSDTPVHTRKLFKYIREVLDFDI
ncbi:MAG: DUF615 domain-containing protein [Gammaproteobacteria bacterium]|nr:DUF615 domain-containing protein [Gammaproteobacteria bacterium]